MAHEAAEKRAADDYVIQRWTVDEGLPQIGVRALAQTRDGYLWLGTFRGLARFDGVKFTKFGVGNTPNLTSDFVNTLMADTDGTLWLGTFANDSLRIDDTGFRMLRPASESVPKAIGHFARDKSGRAFGIAMERLVLIEGDQIFGAKERPWLPTEQVWATAVDRSGILWASAASHLLRVEAERFESVARANYPPPVHLLTFAADGTLWAANPEGVYFFRGDQFHRLPNFPTVFARSLLAATNGDVWIATQIGLFRIRNGQMVRLTTADGLANDSVFALAEDRQGNIWVGSEESGLYRLSERRAASFRFGENGLPAAALNSFMEDDEGRLALATARGLFRLQDGTFESLGPVRSDGYFEPAALARQADGTWWVGSYGHGIFRGKPGQWTRYTNEFVGANYWTHTLYVESDNSVWISGFGSVLHDHAGRLTNYSPSTGVPAASVHAIVRDRHGAIWFGTRGDGLVQMSGGKVRVWRSADGLGTDSVHGFLEDREGRLWIATNGGGLVLFQNGLLQRWTRASGLLGDVILQLHEDDTGHLWLGTEESLSRIHPQELLDQAAGRVRRVHPLRIGRADGAPSDQADLSTSPAGLKQRNGRIWFCTPNGLAMVDPKIIRPEVTRPEVLIEEVRADDQLVSPSPPLHSSTGTPRPVKLGPGVERIEIQYTGFEFNAPKEIQFRYRLEGFDREWVDAGTRRVAFYTHVPPGRYTFRVIAANRDNVWNETGAVLPLMVAPYWWQTIGFRASAGALALALAAQGIRHVSQRRLKRRLEELERQRALERERTRIARDMHDDVGARLTEIALLTDLAQRDVPPNGPAQSQIGRVSSLTREVSKSLREVVWAMNPQNDRLDQLGEYLCQHAGNFLQNTGIRLRLEVPPELPQTPVGTEARHNLFLAFKEALNNATKHSSAGEIRLRIALEDNSLTVELNDNGRGFDSSLPRAGGNGLHNMAQRLRECGGQCELTSRIGEGTRVRFTLPLAPRR